MTRGAILSYTHFKFFFDIVFAFAVLTVLAPFLLLIIVAIKIESKGPAVFKQKRYGAYGRPFTAYKFRSMYTSAPSNCHTDKLSNFEVYVTKVGSVLRRFGMDELPQLVNVIKGEMSLVGPRPMIVENNSHLIMLRKKNRSYECKPGLTGLAQVNGRDLLTPEEKASYDAKYYKTISPITDLKCIVKTIWVIATGAGYITKPTFYERKSNVKDKTRC